MRDKKNPDFYIGIEDPRELRRNILESSKLIVLSMKNQQKLKDIHKEKIHLKNKLKQDIKELKMLMSKLEEILPEHIPQKKQPLLKKPAKNEPEKIREAEIDRLHEHLELIEQKLKKLHSE